MLFAVFWIYSGCKYYECSGKEIIRSETQENVFPCIHRKCLGSIEFNYKKIPPNFKKEVLELYSNIIHLAYCKNICEKINDFLKFIDKNSNLIQKNINNPNQNYTMEEVLIQLDVTKNLLEQYLDDTSQIFKMI